MQFFSSAAGDPAPSRAPGRWGRRIGSTLLVVGLVTLAACAAAFLEAALYQGFQDRWLERARRQPGSEAASARSGEDRLVGRIEIPRLGLSAIIREGIDRHTLLIAVGHVPGTALPGQNGNVVLSGHRDAFFRKLGRVRVNDAVRIVTREGEFHYRVDDTQVMTPDHTEILDPTDRPTLTLITCYPFGFIGPAPKRFIVRALQAPPRRPSLG